MGGSGVTPSPGGTDAATVLVVEDEQQLADLYASWLEEEYDVRTAYGGGEALERVDETVDVVLLDRRMPERDGDEVLAELKARKLDVRVTMVTAVDPDFDLIEMPCEDYLVKPVAREDLQASVENHLALREYDELETELTSKKVKRNVLQVEKTDAELADSREYAALQERIDELERELAALSEDVDHDRREREL